MTRIRSQRAAALAAGVLFGAGLALSGMTQPSKVLGFLSPFGAWDPSLMFVMAGAIAVHLPAYRLIARRPAPLFAERFTLPTRRDLDPPLLAGAALFGVGWGLAGICPGPGLVSLASGQLGTVVFVSAMLAATLMTARLQAVSARARARRVATDPDHVAPAHTHR